MLTKVRNGNISLTLEVLRFRDSQLPNTMLFQGAFSEMDTVSATRRSAIMSHIRSTNTQPELIVRRLLHRIGYRYVLHRRDLPGIPDLVFPSRRKVIFVQGCFWHQHKGCRGGTIPKSRRGAHHSAAESHA